MSNLNKILVMFLLVSLISGLAVASLKITKNGIQKDGQAIEQGGLFDIGNYLPLSGGTLTGNLDLGGNSITGLADPTSAQDAATKSYVDDNAGGGTGVSCPSGYVKVPGSQKFGTEDFCVMKFEAKDDGSGNPVSTATDTVWTGISQVDAKKKCRSLGDGYHLISEREWMTLAYQISNNPNNWADGNIGSKASNNGGLYMGNVAPPSSHSHLGYDASSDPDTRSTGNRPNSARLELENGNYVWDLSGNVWEWTSTRIYTHNGDHESPQQNEANGNEAWNELDEITDWRGLSESRPPGWTHSSGVWNSSQGIGRIYLNGDDTYDGSSEDNQRSAVLRGGRWYTGQRAGLFGMSLHYAPSGATSKAGSHVGFRCTKTL